MPSAGLRARDRLLPLGGRTLLMGIVNVTPDSFSDGGRFAETESAVAHARALEAEGADILDVGGESTRPGGAAVDAAEEARRVVPVIRALAPELSVPISVDTYKAATAAAALEAGAAIVNDVWGFQQDPDIARVTAAHGAACVLMHHRGHSADPSLDILAVVRDYLSRSVDIAQRAGVGDDRIVLDPGIGFGKTYGQNLLLIERLDALRAMGFPVLLGASRKSLIGRITDRQVPADRLFGSIAAHVVGVLRGADIIRAHDVAAHRDALRVADAIRMVRPEDPPV